MKDNNRIRSMMSMLLLLCMVFSVVVPLIPMKSASAAPSAEENISYDYSKHSGKMINKKSTPAVFAEDKEVNEKGVTTYILGDATLDGKLNTGDATMVLRFSVDLVSLNELQLTVADIVQNGTVNTGDATVILRTVVGLLDEQTIDITTPEPEITITYFSGIEGVSIPVPSPAVVIPGTSYTVDSYVPTCSGKKFAGWRSSFDNVLYRGGEVFTAPDNSMTLTGEWTEQTGYPLTVKLYDSLNEADISSFTINIEANTVLRAGEIELPEGYMATDNTEYVINYTDAGITPASITVNACAVYNEGNTKYFVLTTAKGIDNIRDNLAGNYILKNNIDMSTLGKFIPIGWTDANATDIKDFTGIINGNGCWISGLLLNYWDKEYARDVGLVAINSGTVMNLNIILALYEENEEDYGCFGTYNVGIVAGYNDGTIKNCLAQGNVGSSDKMEERVGGAGTICGTNNNTIYQCGANAGVEGFFMIGGVAGKNFGTIEQTWYGGSINTATGDDVLYGYYISYIGGITGASQDGIIIDCYALFLDYICADDIIGGISGWIKGGKVSNVYVAYEKYLYCYSGSRYGTYYGGIVTNPTESNVYSFESVTQLPNGFSTSVWDMNGLCFEGLPDLIKARRPGDE